MWCEWIVSSSLWDAAYYECLHELKKNNKKINDIKCEDWKSTSSGLSLKGTLKGPFQGKVEDQQGLHPEGEEEQEALVDKPYRDSFGALVKNCNMLHNIVGPACIFLKEGFSHTFVCKYKSSVLTPTRWCNLLSINPSSFPPAQSTRPCCSPDHLCHPHSVTSVIQTPSTNVSIVISMEKYWRALVAHALNRVTRVDVEVSSQQYLH